MNSLQTRLIVVLVVVVAVGFLGAGIAVYGFSRASMYAEFDQVLTTKVQTLAALTRDTRRGVRFQLSEGIQEFNRRDALSYYAVVSKQRLLAGSSEHSLIARPGERGRLRFAPVMLGEQMGRQVTLTFQPRYLSLEDDEYDEDNEDEEEYEEDDDHEAEWRRYEESLRGTIFNADDSTDGEGPVGEPAEAGVMTLTWQAPEREVTIAVARDATQIESRLSSLRWILASVGTAVTVLSSLVLALVVRMGFRPVKSVSSKLAQINENNLSQRVPTKNVPSEVLPMVDRLNALLMRLEDAFHRERAFSSNLAHELRTPLAGLKSTLEVYLARLHEPEEYQEAMSVCLEICDQSHNLVENLLALSRVEGKTLTCKYEDVELASVFRDCWQPLSSDAAKKKLETQFDIPSQTVSTDREMLRVILRNVLSNAVSYCDPGGSIEASAKLEGNNICLQLSNSGNELSAEDASRVFDRLWRGDKARYQTGEHFGLGLTLTKRFVEALRGNVSVTVDRRFHIYITLPV